MECETIEPASSQPKTRISLRIEENLAGIIIGLLTIITFANVVVRYLTNFSFAFTEEFSIILMVMMTLLGSSSLMAKGGHLRIDYFVERVPEKYRLPVQIGGTVITAFTFFLLAVLSGRMAWDEFRYEVSSPGLGVPTWIYTIWMPVLFLAITGRAVGRIIRMRRGED